MTDVNMKTRDRIASILDEDVRVKEFKAKIDPDYLNADSPKYDETIEELYYSAIEGIYQVILKDLGFTNK